MATTSNRLHLYQRWLRQKFQEVEDAYYTETDELTQKLGDLELPNLSPDKIPAFAITPFSFIEQWEAGQLTSGRVATILELMGRSESGYRKAARAKLIKPLEKFMFTNEPVADFVKHTLTEVSTKVVPVMEKYLEMLSRAFKSMAEIDRQQIPVTWVEQEFHKGEVTIKSEEMPLNQAIKQLESYVSIVATEVYYIGDQVAVFDIIESMDERVIHWIFAPRTYIELIKAEFEIRDTLEGKAEMEYLKNVIKEVV